MTHVLAVLALAACGGGAATTAPPITNTRSTAAPTCEGVACVLPDVELTDELGITHTPASLKGEVVVVHFWATWAKPSLQDLPQLMQAWDAWRLRDVVILGVLTTPSTDDELKEALLQYPVKYTLVRTPTRDALLGYGFPTAVPQTFVFGRDHARVLHRFGALKEGELARVLESVAR